ncbi:MAG: hypothetical protein AABY32_02600 [Nanoarchaeota archaeon]
MKNKQSSVEQANIFNKLFIKQKYYLPKTKDNNYFIFSYRKIFMNMVRNSKYITGVN